jgi:hypothetical protein
MNVAKKGRVNKNGESGSVRGYSARRLAKRIMRNRQLGKEERQEWWQRVCGTGRLRFHKEILLDFFRLFFSSNPVVVDDRPTGGNLQHQERRTSTYGTAFPVPIPYAFEW